MSPLWKRELSVGLCPGRLIYGGKTHPLAGDPVDELGRVPAEKARVVLSNHYVRYAVLPWSENLKRTEDWIAYAKHSFSGTYGGAAADWDVRVSPSKRGTSRIASAIDRGLVEALARLPQVTSIQPYLMAAYNARRLSVPSGTGWFVVHEQNRLVLGLIVNGEWRIARSRNGNVGWVEGLGDLVEREVAITPDFDGDCIYAVSEDEVPDRVGRFRIVDLTLRQGANKGPRSMVLQ